MARYFLSRHSFACETGRHAVFLDLKRGQYTAVSPESVVTLREEVQGWTRSLDESQTDTGTIEGSFRYLDSGEVDDGAITDLLAKEGLLTADAAMGKDATQASIETPASSLFSLPRIWPMLNAQLARNYVSAWARTTLMLRILPTRLIVNRVRRRKEREAPGARPVDPLEIRRLTAAHLALQPIFYSSHDACLRDSITLLEFLAYYGVYPTWVFGVKMNPFAAHSWVQQGSVVFTDPVDHVKAYTPIMLV